MGSKTGSYKIIGETCGTVDTKVTELYDIFVEEWDELLGAKQFESVSRLVYNVMEICQEHGAQEVRRALWSHIEDIEKELDEAELRIDELTRQLDSRNEELEDTYRRISELEDLESDLQDELHKANYEISNLNYKIAELESELQIRG